MSIKVIDPSSLYIPNQLGQLTVSYDNNNFHITSKSDSSEIPRAFLSKELRGISEDHLNSCLKVAYLSVQKIGQNDFGIKINYRLRGGGNDDNLSESDRNDRKTITRVLLLEWSIPIGIVCGTSSAIVMVITNKTNTLGKTAIASIGGTFAGIIGSALTGFTSAGFVSESKNIWLPISILGTGGVLGGLLVGKTVNMLMS